EPPPGYSIDREVESLAGFADSLGLDRFNLLGYSGGGFVSLAFAGAHPGRLLSLALFEPAAVPGELSPEETRHNAQLRTALAGLDGSEFMRAFVSLQVREGVELPPPPSGPPAPWMRNRPAGHRGHVGGVWRASVRPGLVPRVPVPSVLRLRRSDRRAGRSQGS